MSYRITNQNITFNAFYNNKVNFNNITEEKLNEIMERAKKFNKLFKRKEFRDIKSARYLKLMELINSGYREGNPIKSEYATTSLAEKYLLFMFTVDPEFDAAIIYASEDRIKDIKEQMIDKFGVFDQNLVKIEKYVINKLLTEEKRNEINEEIDRRIFK